MSQKVRIQHIMRMKLAKYYMANAQPDGWADIMVQNQINLLLGGSPDVNAVLRADKVLSQMNHQLFRQSRNYCVKLDMDPSVASGTTIDVYALVDTWWLSKAYKLAKETFDNNSREELAQLKTMKARWNDFRVDHGLDPVAFQKELVAAGATTPGTWTAYTANQDYQMSEVHDANDVSNTFRFVGTGANTWNIIDQYDLTGNTQTTPSNPTGSIAYDGLEDTMDDGQMDHLSLDGAFPPYNRINFENGVFVRIATLTTNTNGLQKLSTGYFNAPAGLIVLQSTTPISQDDVMVSMTAKEGKYKGIHAPSMLE